MRREGRQGLFLLLEQGPRFSPCTAAAPLGRELTCILSLPRSKLQSNSIPAVVSTTQQGASRSHSCETSGPQTTWHCLWGQMVVCC